MNLQDKTVISTNAVNDIRVIIVLDQDSLLRLSDCISIVDEIKIWSQNDPTIELVEQLVDLCDLKFWLDERLTK